MANLPLIVGFGGINCAGRSSGFHSYKRMIHEVLSHDKLKDTWLDLANRMELIPDTYSNKEAFTTLGSLTEVISPEIIEIIKNGTLLRRIESFDPDKVIIHHKAKTFHTSFILKKAKLPSSIPDTWQIETLENNEVKITIPGESDILLPDTLRLTVSSGGNIPKGFDPGKLYNSHHHPRGLKLAVYGASDALNSLGIEWHHILKQIKPDQISVYAGSSLSQVDEHSLAGLFTEPLKGNRINSKMMPLSFAEMPADFINGYIINSIGKTGTNMGACASFLYNLKQGVEDIQSGKAKVVIVGNSEAPIIPEIIEGFRVMGALATDEALCLLDKSERVDNRRACRPFSTNVGFTIAESAQFVVLMDDTLALTLGANIYGAVADIFINADGNKKSISAPGVGNYITVAKAAALAKVLLGADGLNNTYVQAHGTGTPQNRTTESHILNEVAKTFNIKSWPITAIKAYVGHSIGAAAGDQLIASLGVWHYGWIPGIKTIDHIATDVHCSNLNILMDHIEVGELGEQIKAVIINSKGFGGNNATGLVLSPEQTFKMLQKKHNPSILKAYKEKNDIVQEKTAEMDSQASMGDEKIIYKFSENVMDGTSVSMTQSSIKLSEFEQDIDLPTTTILKEYL